MVSGGFRWFYWIKEITFLPSPLCSQDTIYPSKVTKHFSHRRKERCENDVCQPQREKRLNELCELCPINIPFYLKNFLSAFVVERHGHFINFVRFPSIWWELISENHFDGQKKQNLRSSAIFFLFSGSWQLASLLLNCVS